MLVKQTHNLVGIGVLTHRDQALLGCHDRGHGAVELRLEAQVPAGHDAQQIAVGARDHGYAGDPPCAGERQHVADAGLRGDCDRVLDDAAFVFLDGADFAGLALDAHILVNDAEAALLGQGDGETRFGDAVHGRRQQRHVEADLPGHAGFKVDLARQHFRIRRQEQNIIEGEGFLGGHHERTAFINTPQLKGTGLVG